MCGIVGYIGAREAVPILVGGLRRLEYRGYDSAGVAVLFGGLSQVVRCQGKVKALQQLLESTPAPGVLGIGHTRWATHGAPSTHNAHPHKVGRVSVAHNGIVENHLELRAQLIKDGACFSSETDTEVFAHLINRELCGGCDLSEAVRRSLAQIKGAFAIAVIDDANPNVLVAARRSSPLVIGLGRGENFLASDASALVEETRDVIFMDDDDIVTMSRDQVAIRDFQGTPVNRRARTIDWSPVEAQKAGFRHFMAKEIHEQPTAIANTLAGRIDVEHATVSLEVSIDPRAIHRIVIIGCGTSFHAGLVGKHLIEQLAQIPTEVDLGSEFRYRNPLIKSGDLVIAISQSGETADTLAAAQEARDRGAQVLALTNVVDSSISRLAEHTLYTRAGPEIGVASTKAFTTQLACLTMLATYLGRRAGVLTPQAARELLRGLVGLPLQLAEIASSSPQIRTIAHDYQGRSAFSFIGRGHLHPIALEGALKLKEIAYVHAEGYAAGELKHGPIAMVDDEMITIALATRSPTYEKMLSSVAEVRARKGTVIAIATVGDSVVAALADRVIFIPDLAVELQPIASVLPLQLLAYHIADHRGADIDQPRNLAKSVTVE